MKTWFAELLDARPWGLATLMVLALCSAAFRPTLQVNFLILLSAPLLVYSLKEWNLLRCRWLYVHALIVWPVTIPLREILTGDWFPYIAYYIDLLDEWDILSVLLPITGSALVLSCFTLPLLRRVMRTTTSLPRLLAASALLWLVLQKSLFIVYVLVTLRTTTHL